ncbi:MAG: hypothetical protein ABSH52_32075 [Terriglobia bacterium]
MELRQRMGIALEKLQSLETSGRECHGRFGRGRRNGNGGDGDRVIATSPPC